DTTADQHQLQALRERAMALLTTLAVADDIKLVDWLQQRLGLLEHRDTAMLHRLLHDIEKNITK
ncbi:TPA: tRNA/rRNA methyltransferase, partial [Escherichia coli]